mgnify:CR=1 FL=1
MTVILGRGESGSHVTLIFTINDNSKDLDKTNEEVKKENKIVEDYKPDDVVGFFNNIFKNSKS